MGRNRSAVAPHLALAAQPAASAAPLGTLLGYFAEWGVYDRAYYVKNIHTSGSADKLTHINYSFGNVTNGQCTVGDSYAAYDMAYPAANSVDGVADPGDAGALRGNFGQLRKLKQMHPDLKVLWSFGGWNTSGGFGQAAQNPAAFAESCHDLVDDPRWAGVFDGIDIDWEYPNACGATCDTSGAGAFTNLMSALRRPAGDRGDHRRRVRGRQDRPADYGGAARYVDWYNVMTYDYFGGFSPAGPTAPHSPLTSYDGIPAAGSHSDAAIQKLESKGVPASQLLLGIGFYGRGWTGARRQARAAPRPARRRASTSRASRTTRSSRPAARRPARSPAPRTPSAARSGGATTPRPPSPGR